MLIQSVAFRHLQLSPIALTAASRIHPQSPDGKLPAIASLPTAQTQRFAGKKVSLRRRQQADTPNLAVPGINPLNTFMACQQLQCPSGCYRRFVILLAAPSPSFGQLLCPSRHFVHYFIRYASLHLVRSYLFATWLGKPLSKAQIITPGLHQPFASQRYNTHWVPFRFTSSFIHFSSVQSTRCL